MSQHHFDIQAEISGRDLSTVKAYDSLPPDCLLEVVQETVEGVEGSAEALEGLLTEVQAALSQIEAMEAEGRGADTGAARASYGSKVRERVCERI